MPPTTTLKSPQVVGLVVDFRALSARPGGIVLVSRLGASSLGLPGACCRDRNRGRMWPESGRSSSVVATSVLKAQKPSVNRGFERYRWDLNPLRSTDAAGLVPTKYGFTTIYALFQPAGSCSFGGELWGFRVGPRRDRRPERSPLTRSTSTRTMIC